MKTIQACVNARLLKKADRLFTGSLDGRIIEILQNARRAHATRVEITTSDGRVTIRDNGHGITDFAKLLDMGGSGWDESTESSEDPAGVGLFCLAPREVNIRSNGKLVNIGGAGWTGAPVQVHEDPNHIKGTLLHFWDEPWTPDAVSRHAVFTGMDILVDGTACPKKSFVSANATHHPDLGCRIEVREAGKLDEWHGTCRRDRWSHDSVLVNFHGQIVGFDYRPVSEHGLYFLVDMTGEPTGIRLMLPARTRMVENAAFRQLKAAMEREAFQFIQRRGEHKLYFKEYQRARELGINLPEAKPTFEVGLLHSADSPEPVEVVMPKDFALSRCYRLDPEAETRDEFAATNAHLLAALGAFDRQFVPVEINSNYDGYSWAKLPTITKVEVDVGKERHSDWIGCGKLSCVDHLTITIHTSDGSKLSCPVSMARTAVDESDSTWACEHMAVTAKAQAQLCASEIWFHLGGWSEDGDTYDTQAFEFEQALDRFWAELIGPDENMRRELVREAERIEPEWECITITADGAVMIRFKDGATKAIQPPATAAVIPESGGDAR